VRVRRGEPGSLREPFQTRVLRDGQIVVSEGCVHRGPQGGRGMFEHVANGRTLPKWGLVQVERVLALGEQPRLGFLVAPPKVIM
jgi:hypothetical protein